MNLDLFDSVDEPEGAEDPSPPVPSDPMDPTGGSATLPPEPEAWTVSQVNQAVRTLLEESLPPLWISGEVANWKRAGSGHCYFTLKDESAQLRCVMWRGDASRLPMDPEEGMRIRAFGQLTVYEARGEFQLVARSLEAEEGEGLWRMAFQRLRTRLEDEGLLAPDRKRLLPRFPQTVGVVTSLTGAALHDILTVLRRRGPWLRVLVAGARVQGDGASEEIAGAIRRMGASGLVDVLIVGRGGGSLEDLWAFNEEPVARAISECPVPVVSAVGHEVDVTISDLVADLRAPTPSAAAEAVVPDKEELLRYLENAGMRLARGLRRGVDERGRSLSRAVSALERAGERLTEGHRRALQGYNDAMVRIARVLTVVRRQELLRIRESLNREIRSMVRARREALGRLAGKMDALSPLSTLKRGYAVPLDSTGAVLRAVRDFLPGKEFQLRVVDGRIRCGTLETTNIEPTNEEVSGDRTTG
ncbi:MAG: exodeoxyribonuclease VII large subunit [Longimicrobiales bacterium]